MYMYAESEEAVSMVDGKFTWGDGNGDGEGEESGEGVGEEGQEAAATLSKLAAVISIYIYTRVISYTSYTHVVI